LPQLGVRGEEPHRLAGQLADLPVVALGFGLPHQASVDERRPAGSQRGGGVERGECLDHSLLVAGGDRSRVGGPVGRQDPQGVAQPAQGRSRVGQLVVDAGPVGPHRVEQVDGAALVEAGSGHGATLTDKPACFRE